MGEVLDQVEDRRSSDRGSRLTEATRRSRDPEFFSLEDILFFLGRHVFTIGVSVAVALLAMSIYLLQTKPIYRADAQLLIGASFPQVFREQLAEAPERLDVPQVENHMAILRSEQIAMAVVNQMGTTGPADAGSATREPGAAAEDDTSGKKLAGAIAALRAGLQVRRLGASHVIEVSFLSNDPEKSARFANAIVDAYINDQLAGRALSSRQGSRWLEERIEDLRVQMNAAAMKVQEFKARRDYRIVSKSEPGAPDPQQAAAASRAVPNTLEELESTALTYRKIYESYLQAFTESVQRQSYPMTNARVITKAASFKSHPKVMLLLLLAIVGGIGIGLMIALTKEFVVPLLRKMRFG